MEFSNFTLLLADEFESDHQVAFHAHGGAELIYIESGQCAIDLRGVRYSGGPGSVFFIPPGVEHNQLNDGPVRDDYCVYNADAPEWTARCGVGAVGRDYLLEEWFSNLKTLWYGADRTPAAGLFHALVSRICYLERRHLEWSQLDPAGRAMKFIQDHFTDPEIDLGAIAGNAGVSPSYLKLLFKRRFGATPIHTLNALRMERARLLLRNPYLRIGELARRCGYRDPDYFARCFRRLHGRPPREMRAELME